MADILTLGGISFTGYSPPDTMTAGGKQTLVVHKLPGGSRVIDILGPDEAEISWNGTFYGNDAYSNALALDGMRADGQIIPLSFAGQFRSVIIEKFAYHIRRLPVWVEYDITCTVYQNPSLGNLTATTSTIDGLVSSDLGSAASALGQDAGTVATSGSIG